ncbi:MAG: glycosyltransferase family 4 protein [Thermoplasmata archaeon]|nr:glycosyltransferase family 4 protein [Thermoplasmata archaeon]
MAGKQKHVVMLLSNPFRPDPRVHKEAKALVGAGYKVTILCWDREQKYPKQETIDGILIRRLGPESSFTSTKIFLKTIRKFWKEARNEMSSMKIDIIQSHDLDTLSPAVKEAKSRKIPLVYDSHEIYHQMADERLSGFMVKLVKVYEKWLVKKPDAVICVNDRFGDILASWGANVAGVIMGCPPEHVASPEEISRIRQQISPDGKLVVMYIGVLEPNRNVMELVEGFTGGKSPEARLLLGGYGTLEKEVANKSGPRYQFIGPVNPKDMAAYTLASDILVAVYDPAFGNNRDSVPNKLFEAMSVSKPIIVAKGTWTGQTVEKLNCGLAVKYGSDEVFQTIDKLLANKELYEKLGKNGRMAFEAEYNWPVMEKRLLKIYHRLFSNSND